MQYICTNMESGNLRHIILRLLMLILMSYVCMNLSTAYCDVYVQNIDNQSINNRNVGNGVIFENDSVELNRAAVKRDGVGDVFLKHLPPTALIVFTSINHNKLYYKDLRNSIITGNFTRADDYLQYFPAGMLLGMKLVDKGEHDLKTTLTGGAFSVALMAGTVNLLKYTTKVIRPDNSAANSFPSGHTATAFTLASIFEKEYGNEYPLLSAGVYLSALSVGAMRMLNNRHWINDVAAGAVIGVVSTQLGYAVADKIFDGRVNCVNTYNVEDEYFRTSYVGLNIGKKIFINRKSLKFENGVDVQNSGVVGVELSQKIKNSRFGVSSTVNLSNLTMSYKDFGDTSYNVYAGLGVNYDFGSKKLVSTIKSQFGVCYFGGQSGGLLLSNDGVGVAYAVGMDLGYVSSRRYLFDIYVEYEAEMIGCDGLLQGAMLHSVCYGFRLTFRY